MEYRIIVQRFAREDLERAYLYAARNAPETAARWLDRFQADLRTLETNPDRCPLAKEHGKVEVELREFLFGKKPYVFRVVFTIDGETVRVLRIRRAQRRALTGTEVEEASKSEEE
ncbi:MAG: type II toxin-antitoxin system RelE/ParE family toxin [Planctomycetaceae bacterium]|nr:type II toxin-antitoxin system RelE/ParE family toxin [Planctomycetaceae bacterium]